MIDQLQQAVAAREDGRDDEAYELLMVLHEKHPTDPQVNLQCAWINDKRGDEAEAVHYYEAAVAGGLQSGDLQHALLGLGSTYRTLGRYRESLEVLDRGVTEFPDDNGMKVFRAMSLYNSGRAKDACELLLEILATTDQEASIGRYQPAIATYAADLDRTWS